jgi:hypothetical protein
LPEGSFDVYGFRFSVRGSCADVVEGLQQDFAFFAATSESADIVIELFPEDPPELELPATDASVYTPRNVVYRAGNRRYVDYHGRALGIQDELTGNFKLYSRDSNLLYEAAYLYLLSQIGQALDRRRLHRIHALGVAIKNRAVLVLLPMGGGKSTLGLHLLKHPEVQILSDDSPFIGRDGRVLAYPLRLGLLPGSEDLIPQEHRRVISRMEFGPKHLVNYNYFKDRVAASAEPGVVFIGARTLSNDCRIEQVGKTEGLKACFANCIIGVGLFQGLEFVLRTSGWDLLKHTGIGFSRFRNCSRLIRHSCICRIHLGRDPQINSRTLLEYCLHI